MESPSSSPDTVALGCLLALAAVSAFFLWPFAGIRSPEFEFRDTPLGLLVLEKSWDELLLWPSLGFPTLATPGSELEVWVLHRAPSVEFEVLIDNLPVPILGTAENHGIWRIRIGLPENLASGMHDLAVRANRKPLGERKGRNSLAVIPNKPDLPLVAILSDIHVDEENLKLPFDMRPKPLPGWTENLPVVGKFLRDINETIKKKVENGIVKCNPLNAQKLAAVLAHLAENVKPDLVLLTGDLVDWSGWRNWEKLSDILAESDLPLFLVPGNHDWWTRITFFFGRRWLEPFYLELNSFDAFGFQLGSYYFAGVNSGRPWSLTDAEKGSVEREQLRWLKQHLPSENVILFTHYPSTENELGVVGGWDEVLSLQGLELVIAGHKHPKQPVERVIRGVKQIVVPSVRDSESVLQAIVFL